MIAIAQNGGFPNPADIIVTLSILKDFGSFPIDLVAS
jgi:hypothetical protein